MIAAEQKNRRALAIEKALATLRKVRHPLKEYVMDLLIGLLQAEGARRRGEPEVVRRTIQGEVHVRDAAVVRRALHVAIVRFQLPLEVLVALR